MAISNGQAPSSICVICPSCGSRFKAKAAVLRKACLCPVCNTRTTLRALKGQTTIAQPRVLSRGATPRGVRAVGNAPVDRVASRRKGRAPAKSPLVLAGACAVVLALGAAVLHLRDSGASVVPLRGDKDFSSTTPAMEHEGTIKQISPKSDPYNVLHWAIMEKQSEKIEALLSEGADPMASVSGGTHDGLSPLQLAIRYKVKADAILAPLTPAQQRKDIIPMLDHRVCKSYKARLMALSYLGAEVHAVGEVRDAVRRLLTEDPSRSMRVAALKALPLMGGEKAETITSLRAALTDKETQVRLAAVEELRRLGPAAVSVLPSLTAALTDSSVQVRRQVTQALQVIDPEMKRTMPAVLALLRDKDAGLRSTAAWALGSVKQDHGRIDEVVAALQGVLADPVAQVQVQAANSLSLLGTTARPAIPALEVLAQDGEWTVREAAVNTLGVICADVTPVLLAAAEDGHERVRSRAAHWIAEIQKQRNAPAMRLSILTKDL